MMVEFAESGKRNSSVKIVHHQGDILENLDYQLEIAFAPKAPKSTQSYSNKGMRNCRHSITKSSEPYPRSSIMATDTTSRLDEILQI